MSNDHNSKEICPKCETVNQEIYWCQIKHEGKDIWACSYCYNGNYNDKQVARMRDYDKINKRK